MTPAEKLVSSLEALRKLQAAGRSSIRSSDMSRVDREKLVRNGFLREVVRGWYIPTRPDEPVGESTAWFASFWAFCADYLTIRFGDEWCLSPEQSLSLHVGNRTVPKQLIVRAVDGKNNSTDLPHGVAIIDIKSGVAIEHVEQLDGINVFSLPASLVFCSAAFVRQNATDFRAALAAVSNASDVLPLLLEGGHSVVSGRLAGGFRNIGRAKIADDILATMRAADYDCRELDPFDEPAPVLFLRREKSPHVSRLRLMWQALREPVLTSFSAVKIKRTAPKKYLASVQDNYVTDAYHSLSIEGYRVSGDLIERVRRGEWNPETVKADRENRDALAARGYWMSYQSVRESLAKVLDGENAGEVADSDHGNWYRELFAPSVAAGLVRPADLAGYRSDQVFIRHSMHVPPNRSAVRDLMPALFDLLREEEDVAVRAVLGHFMFVYIHPYMDGNGRIGRFLMNVMLASGGYPWTVIPVTRRDDYINALEKASVEQNIKPLAKLLSGFVRDTIAGKPEALEPE